MFRVELGKAVRRWRTRLLAAALMGVPVLIVVAVRLSPIHGQDARDAPPFLLQIVENGLFASLTGLAVVQPFFLPLAIGLFAGDAIAGEAQVGTLRYLLVRPVGRARLLTAKYASAMVLTGGMLLGVVAAGLVAGGIVFGLGPLPTLSGTTLSLWQALLRVGGSGVYILLAASGVTAIGIFISTLTDSGPGAIVATVTVAIASQVVGNIPSLRAVGPYIPTRGWLGYTGLFRFPVDWSLMRAGVVVSLAYTALFLALAAWSFGRRDVIS